MLNYQVGMSFTVKIILEHVQIQFPTQKNVEKSPKHVKNENWGNL